MKTQERKNRNPGQVGRRIRIQINAPAQSRRRVESAWKEEARAVLAQSPLDERPMSVAEMEIASALRQPRLWDVRNEPRDMAQVLLDEAPARMIEQAPVASSRRPAHPWLWWEFVAPIAISIGAILQLIWGVR